tara:strand:+ start:215 stop:478 length:264 start_codon:yes stop_codon:yes gene_type:complete
MKTFKKYLEEVTKLPRGKVTVLQADDDDYDRGLRVKYNKDGSYTIQYWIHDDENVQKIEVELDGDSVKKDAKNIRLLYHPKLKKKDK